MKKGCFSIILLGILVILLSSIVSGQGLEPSREQRLKYGPSLYISEVNSSPEDIEPGSNAVISFQLENVAPHQLRDIVMQLELPSQFAPQDVSKKKIRTLEGLSKIETKFTIIALPTAAEGIYKIPFAVSYIDEIGNSYSENNTISLKVAVQPKIFIELTSSDIYEGNLLGKINIKVANIGIGDIKFLVVELLPSEGYEVIGTNKDYVGALDSDDYETVDFKIKVNEAKEIALKLKLDYADLNNKEYTNTVEIPLKVISTSEAGIKRGNNITIFIIIGILIVYVVYRQIRKRIRKAK